MTGPTSTRGLVYTTSTFSESTIAGKDTCFIPKSKNRSNQQDRDELRLGAPPDDERSHKRFFHGM
jgi:hypothetical protein